MLNVRLLLEYDGSKFHGWQKQPNLKTVQSALESVIKTVLGADIEGGPVISAINASGRTDSGVHARGQVCNFRVDREIDLHRFKHSISSLMKGELSVLEASYVPDEFNSCKDALSKQYTYTILYRVSPAVLDYGRAWHIGRELNIEMIKKEAKYLEGVHDFQSLRASNCAARTSIKQIFSSELIVEPPFLKYVVVGKGFLKQMVRNIVGTLVDLSDNKLDVKSMEELLSFKDRQKAGITAPAHGLCLDWVKY
jgi:tRNA pseudouridine38-40 synthase